MNFVFDIDGTLCFNGKTIDEEIIYALTELSNAGHNVIFASARPIRDLVPVLPASFRTGQLVGGNGCFTFVDGKTTAHSFNEDLLKTLFHIIEVNQLTYLADGEWDYAYTGSLEHPIYKNIDQSNSVNKVISDLKTVCKLVIFNPPSHVLTTLEQLPIAITHYKTENAVDLSPLGINKFSGLEQLKIKDFVAFGNDSNDRCLFKKARYSVCVGENEVGKYSSRKITRDQVATTIIELITKFPR